MTSAVPARPHPDSPRPLVVVPRQPDPALPADLTSHRPLSRTDAQALTDAIRGQATRLWMLVAAAHDRRAWAALGYESWKGYVAAELALSESRSYQLIELGRVMATIAAETRLDPAALEPVPARTVAKVKDRLPALRTALRTALAAVPAADDTEVAIAIGAALADAAGPRQRAEPSTKRKPRPQTDCPVCEGAGTLGSGAKARELAAAAARWLARRQPSTRR